MNRDYELAGDINHIVPRCMSSADLVSNADTPAVSRQVVTFEPDNSYVGNLTSPTFKNDTKDLWLSLVPSMYPPSIVRRTVHSLHVFALEGLGFVEIQHPEKYPPLSTPYMKYNKTVYTTSVTHQLHCLYMIMHGFNELALRGDLNMDMDADEGLTREGEDPSAHLSHCFDYLRQAIMCHGDTALEGLQTTFGPDVGGSDGWNTQHVCKRYGEVYDWLEEKRIDDRIWIS